jgi:predicted dehydrogenase
MLAKEQILQGRLGEILGIQQRVYNARAQFMEILKRAPTATAVNDVLTYYVDMACWYLEGHRPIEVVAREQKRVFKSMGYDVGDVTWAIVTFDTGAVVNLGISYVLPPKYPTVGQSARFEIIGSEGVILLDADNKEQGQPALHRSRRTAHVCAGPQRQSHVHANDVGGRLRCRRLLGRRGQRDALMARPPDDRPPGAAYDAGGGSPHPRRHPRHRGSRAHGEDDQDRVLESF